MIEIKGLGGIGAKVIADSITERGERMTTFELEYHRFVHSENLVHKMLSANSSSSRAIPLGRAINMTVDQNLYPIHWGAKQAGMQARNELDDETIVKAKAVWDDIRSAIVDGCKKLDELGAHKQWAARPLEAFQTIKVVRSGTDWNNFLWLRDDDMAQPEIRELAKCIKQCLEQSIPEILMEGDLHVPYVNVKYDHLGLRRYYDSDDNELTIDEAMMISTSCCAQISYRKLDDSKEDAIRIYRKLFEQDKVHASPSEHVCSPIGDVDNVFDVRQWPDGVTHVTRHGELYSGNLRGWIQFRQLIKNHVVRG